jgi:hypothetical protein
VEIVYQWRGITDLAKNTILPMEQDANPSKIYNRFRIATYGDFEIALVMTVTDDAVYAFRIPSS